MRRHVNRNAAIDSLEAMLLMSASTIEGSNGNDWIAGDGNDNAIFAGAGNDEIYAPLGNNVVDGGSGDDTFVVYEGNRSNFSLSQLADGSFLLEGPGINGSQVSNRLINVESISFNDGAVSLSVPAEQNSQPDNSVQEQVQQTSNNSTAATQSDSNAGQWIAATGGNDNINAGAGNDTIYAPLGNNTIDGGSGFDTLVVYEGSRSQYSITQLSNGRYQVEGLDLNGTIHVNTLTNVEQIQFNDQIVSLQNASFADTPQQAQGFGANTPVQSQQSEPAQIFETNDIVQQQEPEQVFEQVEEPVQIQTPEPATVAVEPSQPQVSDFVAEVIRLTNNIRAENGLGLLTFNSELQAAAVGHSNDMAFQDFFSHTGLDGQEPWDRAIEAGYNYQNIGENIAAGQLSPQEVVQAWFDSPSHRDNLLNPEFTEIGVGYTFLQNDTGSVNFNHYWSQLLGREQ